LAQTLSLSELEASDLGELAAKCRVGRARRGPIIFTEGDRADSVVILDSGTLRVLVAQPEGGELVLRVIGPADSLREIGCLDGGPRSATVEAVHDSLLIPMPAPELLALVARRPQLARYLLSHLATDLRRLTGSAADLVFLDVPRRVAKLLGQVAEREARTDLELIETQAQVGARIGGTRQSVNSALHALERRGWLEVSSRHVSILNLEALRRFASS
jgi:CRP-like cAMP-binding protein